MSDEISPEALAAAQAQAAELAAQQAAGTATPAAPVAKESKKAARAKIIEAAEGETVFATPEKHSVPFDIMIAGEVLPGQWAAKDGIVEFAVPNRLVEGFKKHYHFVAGNVVEVE